MESKCDAIRKMFRERERVKKKREVFGNTSVNGDRVR